MRLRQAPPPVGDADPAETTRLRFVQRRRARRLLVLRRVLLALAGSAVLAGAVWLVFFSSALAVQGARVTGVSVLTEAEVEQTAEVPSGVPMATVDLDAIEARVEGLAAVESVEASRAWPDQVHIEVVERRAVAAVLFEGSWRGLDDDGVLFRRYPSEPDDLPRLTMAASTPIEALAEAATIIDSLPADILRRVRLVDVGSIDAISLELRNGSVVNWGSADESDDKAAVLTVLLKREAKVYDVTAPGRPTLRN